MHLSFFQSIKTTNMKNKFLAGLLIVNTLVFLFACNPKKAEPETVIDKEQIKQEIQAKENEFAEIYNSGEVKNIGYYADDAISFVQDNPPLKGKMAIVDYLKANLDSVSKSRKISFTTNEVFVAKDGSQVLEIGAYKVVDSTNTILNSGNYMSLFVKKDGKYYSLRDMSACDIPLP
jgi:ketosteroid isomerase-like protein